MKLISLTFDDGPDTDTTCDVLDRLARYNIPASFFLIGQNINAESRKSAERALKQGCEIENHSFTHSDMTKLSPDEIIDEVSRTTELIKDISGRAPQFFRPPYICYDQKMFDNIPLTFICGSGCDDWMPETSVEKRYRMTMEHAKNGEMILLHDMTGNVNTVNALDLIIPDLLYHGFEFVTVSSLFERLEVTPQRGRIYSNVFSPLA
ncbi:MAG: polysaccharide deacetylase family protein [Oscillospiraceae bacterium]|nr:polysaccharide deacetylase family protein [Oscillospiraceae bacterium]